MIKSSYLNKNQLSQYVWMGAVVLAFVVLFLRWLLPERSANDAGPRALLDTIFALSLWGYILLLAGGVGQKIKTWLNIEELSSLEQLVFYLPIGLAILAYGVMALGVVGWLRVWTIVAWLLLVTFWTWPEWRHLGRQTPYYLGQCREAWARLGSKRKLFVGVVCLILGLTSLQALTPPWSYDALMYHLYGPLLFLQRGRIELLPNTWQANGPATINMLYLTGLALKSDILAQLLHLLYGVLLGLSTFSAGKRYISPLGGWIALAILLGIPILPFWASWAYTDMAWALYEFLALYAFILWVEKRHPTVLGLCGLMVGLSLGSKYLALGIAAIIGLGVVGYSWQQRWRDILVNGVIFGVPAVIVGLPWYAKNWFLSGNPVYPLVFGGPEWNHERLDLLMTFLNSFGTGHGVGDYLLLPWNIYARRNAFVGFMGGLEWPSLLFPLVLLYPFLPKSKVMNIIAWVMLARFLLWAGGSQQTRFLLPLFPGLSLLATKVLLDLTAQPILRRWKSILLVGLNAGMILITVAGLLISTVGEVKPFAVITGFESKESFLKRMIRNYPALSFIQENLSPEARILMLWDGQGYYCEQRCLPDPEQSRWTYWATQAAFHVPAVAEQLHTRKVTHILFSLVDANFIAAHHDPTGQQAQALQFFWEEFRPACTQEIYRDDEVALFELICTY